MYFCKICKRQLAEKGDICTDCYEGLIEEEENKDDNEVLFTFKAKFSFGYELMKSPFTFFIIVVLLIFFVITSFETKFLLGFLYLFIFIGGFVLYFLFNKIRTESRVIKLYKHKLTYDRKLHIKNHYEVKYRDIEEIHFEDAEKKTSLFSESSWWLKRVNKKYKMTDLFFKLKKSEETFFPSLFIIKPVHNFKEDIMPNIMKIMGFEENTEERRSNIEEMLNINIKRKNKDKDKKSDKDKDDNSENKEKDKEDNKQMNKDKINNNKNKEKR